MKAFELDKRIIEVLKNRGYKTDKEINDFLEPNFSMLLNPFDLDGMKEAKERIEKAIALKEKIVIYGDYDCDGISACVILYKYFKSKGVICDVYIPNRFDDGYGLSFDMIDEVVEKSKPNLIITVDLGVTAVKEVEKIKSMGVDIVVTDHHEPSTELPDCVVIDPKKEGQKYAFDGLCGAGVALKLVEALAGIEEAKKYLDVCAIATIGDIVPLVSENRVIAKFGIEKLNKGECINSYKFMFEKLGLKKLNATDITFKIVPRINASGRMSNAKKVFDFLIEEDSKKAEILYDEMTRDNEQRLESINEGVVSLEKEMENVNLAKENIILLIGDFHQGVLGILASRICHDYNRPAIIFTKTEDGTYKGSGRSLDEIDLHLALENVSSLLTRYGGHKMAVGVELEIDKFDEFKKLMAKEISKQSGFKTFITKEKFDIKIDDNDISKGFISQLEALEPFGCKNEKPTLMLEARSLKVQQMKENNYRHFKLVTRHGKSIVAFSSERHIEALKSSVKKHIIVELENNEFKGKIYPQAILKNVYIKEVKLEEDKERECILSLISKYQSENSIVGNVNTYNLHELDKLLLNLEGVGFGTIVVVDSFSVAERMKTVCSKLKNYTISHIPLKNKQNTILISNRYVVAQSEICGYNNVVFTRSLFNHEKDVFAKNLNVYTVKDKQKLSFTLDNSRNVNIMAYNIFKKYTNAIKANNIFEWLDKIQETEKGLSKIQLIFSLLSFEELGFMKVKFAPEFIVEVVESPPKRELSSSKFMNKLTQRNY
ncbi:MAG: single-stranded-DNA-specific exonuclease RecJ [Clostridia bacterium]|nr:single-stranded-DNA-specific exonuclease RecJ [Clostridia bacterium]